MLYPLYPLMDDHIEPPRFQAQATSLGCGYVNAEDEEILAMTVDHIQFHGLHFAPGAHDLQLSFEGPTCAHVNRGCAKKQIRTREKSSFWSTTFRSSADVF